MGRDSGVLKASTAVSIYVGRCRGRTRGLPAVALAKAGVPYQTILELLFQKIQGV